MIVTTVTLAALCLLEGGIIAFLITCLRIAHRQLKDEEPIEPIEFEEGDDYYDD